MNKQIIIGLGHKARHGKDTAAAAILDYYARKIFYKALGPGDYKTSTVNAFRVGFADELYRICREEYGMKDKDAPLLQKIGAARRESHGADYWIKMAFAKIKPEHNIVVIPDVRYRNEAEYIKSQGGYLVNVSRLTEFGTPYVDDSRPANHISEIDLDGYTGWNLKLTIGHGDQALTGELAVAYVEYLRGLHS